MWEENAELRRRPRQNDDFVTVTSETLQWQAAAPFTLDVAQFEAALAQAEVADREGAVDALAAAVAAYGGDLLPDCYDDWILPLREQMRRAYGQALERLVLMLDEQRDYARAIRPSGLARPGASWIVLAASRGMSTR
ncbi:MAG: bacterial transcriptional activator domain-containing protein [Anaerolineae bacterium]|nr:bacterial transcriptional activator domain-containing protein [Anaerolineae bacterium]